jgi:hypothetical protein
MAVLSVQAVEMAVAVSSVAKDTVVVAVVEAVTVYIEAYTPVVQDSKGSYTALVAVTKNPSFAQAS